MLGTNKVSRYFLSVTFFMFLMVVAARVTPVTDLDGTSHQSTTAGSDTGRGGMLDPGTPHAPIAIDGDANFYDTALLEGWPGDGSPENPYMIDGLEIDLEGEIDNCISICNTRVNFTISSCNLTGADVGISLENVTNGELVNNTCSGNFLGIELYESKYNTVVKNICNNNDHDGIFLCVSSHNTVSDNTCKNNNWGINLVESDYNTVGNNTCSSNRYVGIRISDAGWNEIHDNTCSSNTECGISVEAHSESNTVTDNTCNYNDDGISLDESYCNTVANSTCNNNKNGISLSFLRNNTVVNSICTNNRIGISLSLSKDNTMVNSICTNNKIGISLDESDSNTVSDNTCFTNFEEGIFLDHSDSNTVDNNTCNRNDIGISLFSSWNNTVVNNICTNNDNFGIYLSGSDSNTVTDNTCESNRIGIYLFGSDANILSNNICLGNSEHDLLEESIFMDPVGLLLVGVVGITLFGAGWRIVKILRADVSETWIDGSAIVKHGLRQSCFHAWSRADAARGFLQRHS